MLRMLVGAMVVLLFPTSVFAHCDTLDGPVAVEAKAALEKNDVTPLLKWVTPANEAAIKEAFAHTQQVRKLSPQARELADMYFLETLVRLHRAGEGAPYTGLKPAGTELDHAVVAADEALASGSDEELVQLLTDAARHGLHERFTRVRQAREHVNESVAAGRAYVAAYVEYVHYAERVHQAIVGAPADHAEAAPAAHEH